MSRGIEHLQRVGVTSVAALHQWLLDNHTRSESVWLVTFKKATPEKYVSREEVLDELIAFGWIDGVRQAIDEVTTMQLISPRQTKPWAKTYKDRAERLAKAGRMHSAGLDSMNAAKASGTWDQMNEVDELIVPNDLAQALALAGRASEYFDAFPQSIRRNILRWISSAKRPETRQKRIIETVAEAQFNRRVKSHG
jgi:uncharacterized protein YdeI (YjbR/CyaY-like superfamily)